MMIQSVSKGRATTSVVILDTANSTDGEVVEAALSAARENANRLYGWGVKRYDGNASCVVELWTD